MEQSWDRKSKEQKNWGSAMKATRKVERN